MNTRIYLKECPSEGPYADLLKLDRDEYGWYYNTDWDLELLELPLAIHPVNVRKVTVCMHFALSQVAEIGDCSPNYQGAVGVFNRLGPTGSLYIKSDTLADAQNLWKRFKYGVRPPFSEGGREMVLSNPSRGLLRRALNALLGSK